MTPGERDAALEAALPRVPALGWDAAAEGFPGGAMGMVAWFSDRADRAMAELAATPGFQALRTTARVRALVLHRLGFLERHRDAVRRAAGLLARPGRAGRLLAGTVDQIWNLAGDAATDANRHSKRAILAGVYAATLLYWLRDPGAEALAGFLDRRLAGAARIGRMGQGVRARLRPAA
jgi:ubiquinone biosynthesis protein COQ9